MFGINDDGQNQAQPGPAHDAPTMPGPVPHPDDLPVNPISGHETLGPPQVNARLPSVIPGAGAAAPSSIIKNKQLLTPKTPAGPMSASLPSPAPLPSAGAAAPPAQLDNSDAGELLSIKKQALQSLVPLVDELEQPPAEKFKTLMMLMQASDNPHLVKEAYETANKIPDEKAKAQALLDVVNEINYFTHPENKVDEPAGL